MNDEPVIVEALATPAAKPKKLGTIGTFVKEQIVPPVIDELGEKWDELEPKLLEEWNDLEPKLLAIVDKKLDEWLPRIIQAILLSLGTASGNAIANAEDGITNWIPGTLDDKLDPYVKGAFDQLGPMIAGMLGGQRR